MIKGVIFDLDGTLLNTLGDLTNAVNYSLSKYNLAPLSNEKVRSYIGSGIKELMKKALNDDSIDIDEALKYFKYHYERNIDKLTVPYEGIIDLLKELKENGYKIAIVSNKYQEGVERLTHKFFEKHINICYGNMSNIPVKPNITTTNMALNKMGITNKECLFVGDSNIDALTAKNANMKFVYVSWGYKDYQYVKDIGIDYVINNANELLNILKENKND